MNGTKKKILFYLFDVALINLATLAAVVIGCNFDLSANFLFSREFFISIPILSAFYLILMWFCNERRILWEFAEVGDRFKFGLAVILANLPYTLVHCLVSEGFTAGIYIIAAVLMVNWLLLFRSAYRGIYELKKRKSAGVPVKKGKNVMIIGAGRAGSMLLRDMENSPDVSEYRVVCFIDDDETKIGGSLGKVRIVGNTSTILENAKKYEISLIIFAIPSCSSSDRARILSLCAETGCTVKTLPGVSQIVNGQATMKSVRDVQAEDLLGRNPVTLNFKGDKDYLYGRVVLVTGGGGSIGSELCRQIASCSPQRLIIFDIYENNVYEIQNELKSQYPGLNLITLIGSVRDSARVESVFAKYHPDVIFHAAAHKHVPLMEDSPHEAIKNNVFGTLNVVKAADRFGAKRFIMISTDKAVNPTNIMGASKRICEMIIQSYDKRSATDYVAVRFGNVLGSNGSVIPLFKKQIEAGGPVTVTHPDIIRYFMTIPEAVSLVLEAGRHARGGEIFVLDMGQPVRILTLAENLIKLSGYTPYRDIDIVFTGLRPGEKLYEEILMKEEGLTETGNKLIYIGKPLNFNEDELFRKLEELKSCLEDESRDIHPIIKSIVPTYNRKYDT